MYEKGYMSANIYSFASTMIPASDVKEKHQCTCIKRWSFVILRKSDEILIIRLPDRQKGEPSSLQANSRGKTLPKNVVRPGSNAPV